MKKQRMIFCLIMFGTIMICCISASASSLKTYQYSTKTVSVDTYSDYTSLTGFDRVYYLVHQYGKDVDAVNTNFDIFTYKNGNYTDCKTSLESGDLNDGDYVNKHKIENNNGRLVTDASGITVRVRIDGVYKYNIKANIN